MLLFVYLRKITPHFVVYLPACTWWCVFLIKKNQRSRAERKKKLFKTLCFVLQINDVRSFISVSVPILFFFNFLFNNWFLFLQNLEHFLLSFDTHLKLQIHGCCCCCCCCVLLSMIAIPFFCTFVVIYLYFSSSSYTGFFGLKKKQKKKTTKYNEKMLVLAFSFYAFCCFLQDFARRRISSQPANQSTNQPTESTNK